MPPKKEKKPTAPDGVQDPALKALVAAHLPDLDNSSADVKALLSAVDKLLLRMKTDSSGRILQQANLLVVKLDGDMNITLWNNFAVSVMGYTQEEMVGKPFNAQQIVPEDIYQHLESAFSDCLDGGSLGSCVVPFTAKNNAVLYMIVSACALSDDGKNKILLMAHDVTFGVDVSYDDSGNTTSSMEFNRMLLRASEDGTIDEDSAPTPAREKDAHQKKSYVKIPGWDLGDDYVVDQVLGQGSYGQVVRAKHLPTGEVVAIKRINNVFADPIDAKRILREICILRQLKHPNIIQIKDIIPPKTLNNFKDLHIVFEYLPTDLEKLLHSPQFLTAEHLRWLLLDLLKALKYLHSTNIVHRDLKPANVLLNLSPVAIKICDFGLARGLDSKETRRKEEQRMGVEVHPRTPTNKLQRQLTEHVVTRWYRAPEIIFRDHNYTTEIDVWSVGCIFAELLSMQESSCPSHYDREPLFPGVSCFPLSPGASSPALPQDSRDQLNVILDVVGSMSEEDIQDIADEDVRKYLREISYKPKRDFRSMYPGAEKEALELLEWMLQMNPNRRASIDEALNHPYLASIRNLEQLEEDSKPPKRIVIEFDEENLTIPQIRDLMRREILYFHPELKEKLKPAEKKKRDREEAGQTEARLVKSAKTVTPSDFA